MKTSEWSQVRRCHRCGHTHEAFGERVSSCPGCAARFAPFYFADTTPLELSVKRKTTFRPLIGIAVWWSDASETETEVTQRLRST